MMEARVGDDVFEDDPTVNELQQKAAAMFGMEAALFVPSGTMSNQIAIKVHTVPGDEVICSEQSHIYRYEGGGIAMNSGASVKLISGSSGIVSAKQVEDCINVDDVHFPNSQLVSLENTSNRGGGLCYDKSTLQEIKAVAESNNLAYHLDGARLFNALVYSGQTTEEYGQLFDSISVCLSKGLGAPVGSLLLGKRNFIKKARRVRKVFGGGMRQAGYLAAAGIYALDHNIARLADDHKHAQVLAEAAAQSDLVEGCNNVQTNIVIIKLKDQVSNESYLNKLETQDILAVPFGPGQIRLVTHLDVTVGQVDQACNVLRGLS